jgi:hypothetical protein
MTNSLVEMIKSFYFQLFVDKNFFKERAFKVSNKENEI